MKHFAALFLLLSALQTSLAAHAGERVADGIRDLPLYEVPATGTGETLSLLITGDGGWAGLAQQVSAGLLGAIQEEGRCDGMSRASVARFS